LLRKGKGNKVLSVILVCCLICACGRSAPDLTDGAAATAGTAEVLKSEDKELRAGTAYLSFSRTGTAVLAVSAAAGILTIGYLAWKLRTAPIITGQALALQTENERLTKANVELGARPTKEAFDILQGINGQLGSENITKQEQLTKASADLAEVREEIGRIRKRNTELEERPEKAVLDEVRGQLTKAQTDLREEQAKAADLQSQLNARPEKAALDELQGQLTKAQTDLREEQAKAGKLQEELALIKILRYESYRIIQPRRWAQLRMEAEAARRIKASQSLDRLGRIQRAEIKPAKLPAPPPKEQPKPTESLPVIEAEVVTSVAGVQVAVQEEEPAAGTQTQKPIQEDLLQGIVIEEEEEDNQD
jgi:hypothetical protein